MRIPIQFVIETDLGACGAKHGPRGTYNICCPFCGGEYKLNVNEAKGVWRCAKCGEAGNAAMLHEKLAGFPSYREARNDLEHIYNGRPEDKRQADMKRFAKLAEAEKQCLKPANLETRDRFYRAVISQLSLNEAHRASLLARGLSEQDIARNWYVSYPTTDEQLSSVAKKAIDGIFLLKGEGIPGLYDAQRSPKLIRVQGGGIMIPVRTMTGMISGFQIRKDKLPESAPEWQRKKYAKYIWLSSAAKKTGCSCSGSQNIHFAGEWPARGFPKVINLTEGVLKADVAAALTGGKPWMGVAGVSNLSHVPDLLSYAKICGAEKVNICYDMDYRDKKEVRAALQKLIDIIKASGLSFAVIRWDAKYKGIDDFLLHCRKDFK